jgi:hypothetical protein
MKGCLGGIIFVIFLSVLDVLLGKVLPFETLQTVRLIFFAICLVMTLAFTWRKRENLNGWVIALIGFIFAVELSGMIILIAWH